MNFWGELAKLDLKLYFFHDWKIGAWIRQVEDLSKSCSLILKSPYCLLHVVGLEGPERDSFQGG